MNRELNQNELENIIRDADSSHFAKEYFHEVSELLRQEFKANEVSNFSKNGITFLLHNEKFTDFWVNWFSDLYNFIDDGLWSWTRE